MVLTTAEFRAAFPEESSLVEFKAGVSGAQLQDTAVAFSNARGGVILIGVADDGTVRGRRLDAGTQDDIHGALATARDVGRYALHQVDVDDHADGAPSGVNDDGAVEARGDDGIEHVG
jgi:predicted HTH transcriptional regulator